MNPQISVSRGRQAIVEALAEYAARSRGLQPWMAAAALAGRVGATSAHDPQFESDVQALFDADTIRLMSGGNAGGANFYNAMLIPEDDAPAEDATREDRA